MLASGDGEHVLGTAPLRVLVRMKSLAETFERLGVTRDVPQLGGARAHDAVERREQRPALGAAERTEVRRSTQRDVPIGERARQAQHVDGSVHKQRKAMPEADAVDHGPVLAHADRFGLRIGGMDLCQRAQQRQVGFRDWHRAPGEFQVQAVRLLRDRPAAVEDGDAVPGGRDQLVVGGKQLLVGVLVAAVARQVEEVHVAGCELACDIPGGPRVGQRIRDTPHPELDCVGDVVGEVPEVRVVAHVVSDECTHGVHDALAGLLDGCGISPERCSSKPREQVKPTVKSAASN